jgi:cytochrome c-type biogenesis protein
MLATLNTFLDGSHVNVLVAFVAGFVTFFASCLLPLVPTYLAYLSGVSLSTPEASEKRWQIVQLAAMFVLGFSTTFVVLGLTLQQFATVIAPYRSVVEKLAGLLFIALGFFMLGIFKHQWFTQERRLNLGNLHGLFAKHRNIHAALTGVAFGFGWTPCIGPVLAVILYWASQQASMFSGAALLIAYSIGLGIPFILVAIGFEKLIPLLKKNQKISHYTNIISALVIMLAGVLMTMGVFQQMSAYFLTIFDLHLTSF